MLMTINLNTRISELLHTGIISVRTYNCLYSKNMNTLEDVLESIDNPIDLLKIRGFGKKSYSEMLNVINNVQEELTNLKHTDKEAFLNSLGEEMKNIITKAYNDTLAGDDCIYSYLRTLYPQPINLHEFVMTNSERLLDIADGYTLEENLRIRYAYRNYIYDVKRGMEKVQKTNRKTYRIYKQRLQLMEKKMSEFSYEQRAMHFLSPTASQYVEKVYQNMCESKMNIRTKNFKNTFLPHFLDLLKYADKPLETYREICSRQKMKKTLTEVFRFNQEFREFFDNVFSLTDEEIREESIKNSYPYLKTAQYHTVFDYMRKHNSLPLFYIMLQGLRSSEMRSDQIYSMLHGISGRFWTLHEIADKVGLTVERVRQISMGTINIQTTEIASNEDWKQYANLFEHAYICPQTEEYIKVNEEEKLDISFNTFAYILALVGDFRVEEVDKHAVLINKNKLGEFKFKDCIDTLQSFVNTKYSKDKYIPIDNVLFTVPEDKREQVRGLIEYIAAEVYNVETTPDKQLFIPQNYIDTPQEVYEILTKHGKPMHVKDIFREFKAKYPNHKYKEALQIKPSLYANEHIKAVGKSSKYALDTWEGVYFGSIRDLLVDLLSKSDEPLHIDTLFKEVVKHYPETNKSSVFSTMFDINRQRFVAFERGYFGLSSKKYSDKYKKTNGSRRSKFEDRLNALIQFVEENRRFPTYNGSNEEASLQRWTYNIRNNIIEIDEKRRQIFNATIERFEKLGYPRTMQEYEFQTECKEVETYIVNHHNLPNHKNTPKLYTWFHRSYANHKNFTDKRRRYMEELIAYISSVGLNLD